MSEKSNASFEKRIREAIEKTGLPTEIRATNYLTQNGWFVKNEFPYIDVENKRVRTLDIKATLSVDQDNTNMQNKKETLECELYIECKKSEKPWIFYVEARSWSEIEFDIERLAEKMATETFNTLIDGHIQSGKITYAKDLKKPVSIFSRIPVRLQSINYKVALSHQIIFVKTEDGKKPKNKVDDEPNDFKDEIYSAEMQILKALKHQENHDKLVESSQTKRRVIIPVMLLNGNMFGCYYENQELQTPKISYTRHLAHGLPNQEMPALIDVMTLDYFPEFLKLLKSELLVL